MRAYERLLRYAPYPTVSDENSDTCPSTPEQLEFDKDKGRIFKDVNKSCNGDC